jgi:hypothetical protein
MHMHLKAVHKPPMVNGKVPEKSMLTIEEPKRKSWFRRLFGL